ncbi:MAG: DUF4191 domain-containing protein [Micrococcaceae bacterium]
MAKNETSKPGYWQNIKQAYQIAKDGDPKTPLWLALIFIVTIVVVTAVVTALSNLLTGLLISIPLALLLDMVFLSRVAEKYAFKQIEGQPGAAGAILSSLNKKWITEEQPVAVDPRSKDVVFRAIGRPGVVLISEGPPHRAKKLLNKEKLKTQRVVPSVPIHLVQTGNQEGQVPLNKATGTVNKLKKTLTSAEVTAVASRLSSLQRNALPIPKGMDPNKVRPNRKMMR